VREGLEENTARLVETARDPEVPLSEQHAAFARLIERSQSLVFGLALASLRDVEDARDAAQDALLTAWLRLRQLRDASAFLPWVKTIVASCCARQHRLRNRPELTDAGELAAPDVHRRDHAPMVASALAALPKGEREVTVLFYVLGYTQPEISRMLGVKAGTVGKRLHSARLRIRRRLPPSVRREFVRLTPTRTFVEQIRLGLFDAYLGKYRFENRPDRVVSITRVGDCLVGDAGGQRHVLLSAGEQVLRTLHYDGEGRFRRDVRGNVTHFVYYEFGRRLGVARKIPGAQRRPRPTRLVGKPSPRGSAGREKIRRRPDSP
jgi:RNA polymerase sigma factor (sigma-70 family)